MKIPYPSDGVLFKRWLKFNAVGTMGTCAQLFAVYLLGFLLRVDSMVSTALGVEAAILHNFIWHQHFTWLDRPPFHAKDVLRRFLSFNATTGAMSITGNLLLVSLVMREVHAPLLAANVLAIAACSLGNFAVSEIVIFRARKVTVFNQLVQTRRPCFSRAAFHDTLSKGEFRNHEPDRPDPKRFDRGDEGKR